LLTSIVTLIHGSRPIFVASIEAIGNVLFSFGDTQTVLI
jgi:hypothetical protein